jgi:hypothetical protein
MKGRRDTKKGEVIDNETKEGAMEEEEEEEEAEEVK